MHTGRVLGRPAHRAPRTTVGRHRGGLTAALLGVAAVLTSTAVALADPTPDSGPVVGGTVVQVQNDLQFTEVYSTEGGHYALDSDGHLYGWGRNDDGRLGDGGIGNRYSPVPVPLGGDMPADVGVRWIGGYRPLVLGTDGWVYTLPNGAGLPTALSRVGVPSGVTFTKIAPGSGAHGSAAIGTDGNVYTWGKNTYGQFANGTWSLSEASSTPTAILRGAIPAGVRIVDIAVSEQVVAAVGDDGWVYTWGGGDFGIGTGGAPFRTTSPVAIAAGEIPAGVRITSVTAGVHHLLLTGSDGLVYGFGDNVHGQMGTGTNGGIRYTPVRAVTTGLPAGAFTDRISSNLNTLNFLVTTDGTVYTFGDDQPTPTVLPAGEMPAGVTAAAVTGGYNVQAVLGSDGRVYTWGRGDSGALGVGEWRLGSATPVLGPHFAVSAVTFDGAAGSDLTRTADGAEVTTPPHAAGPVDVVVTSSLFAGLINAGQPHDTTFEGGFTYLEPPLILTQTLPNGTEDQDYASPVEASGTGPLTFVVTSGSLPTGLTLDPTTGVVSGVPTQPGSFTFTVQVSNAVGQDSREYTAVVEAAPVHSTPSPTSSAPSTTQPSTTQPSSTQPSAVTPSTTTSATSPAGSSTESPTSSVTIAPTSDSGSTSRTPPTHGSVPGSAVVVESTSASERPISTSTVTPVAGTWGGPRPLAFTGLPTVQILMLSGLLVAAGGLFLIVTQRRRQASEH